MKSLLEFLILFLLEKPEDLIIEEKKQDDNFYIYSIKVNKDDLGRVIGYKGNNINNIRRIAKIYSSLHNIHAKIEVVE